MLKEKGERHESCSEKIRKKIGPYKIGRTLGVGTFCKVKLAIHEVTGEKVAVKILNRKKLNMMDMGTKVRTEIEFLRLFTHPHIIRLYEVIDTPSDIFSIMEYVPGGELFDHIVAKGRLGEKEARRLFQELISGVEYCHTHLVCHRDLKPENVLLDTNNHVKLVDFGLSNRLVDGRFLRTSCGSPNYAAPEVISGSFYSGPEVDVWSCGVILYAVLCGTLPFDDDNIRSLFRKIKGGIYSIPTYVSDSARDLVKKLLVVDPMKRLTIPDIKKHEWFNIDVPPYLALTAEQQIARTQMIDQQILDKVVEMGFSQDNLLAALAMGSELLTSTNYTTRINTRPLREMAVTYHLLLAAKRRKEQEICYKKSHSGKIGEYKKNRKSLHQLVAKNTGNISLQNKPEKKILRKNPFIWNVGNQFVGDPKTIMNKICLVLKKYEFEWKMVSLYTIKARHPIHGSDCSSSLYESRSLHSEGTIRKRNFSPNMVKIGIQLFRISKIKNYYMVDLTKLFGQTFIFLDLCGLLITEFNHCLTPIPLKRQTLQSKNHRKRDKKIHANKRGIKNKEKFEIPGVKAKSEKDAINLTQKLVKSSLGKSTNMCSLGESTAILQDNGTYTVYITVCKQRSDV